MPRISTTSLPQVVKPLLLPPDVGLDAGELLLFLGQLPDAAGNQVLEFLGEGVPNLAVYQLRQLVRETDGADVILDKEKLKAGQLKLEIQPKNNSKTHGAI